MLCFAVVFLVFWSTLPVFRSKMGSVPENLQSRTFFHRGLGREIMWNRLLNHQYSLGFNWYFERGDDGKLDSKSTKIQLVSCRVSATFPPNSRKVVAEVSMNHWYVYIFCYFSRKSLEFVWRIPKKWLDGSQKHELTSFEKVAKTLHNTNDILMFWKRDFLISAFLPKVLSFML